MFGAISGKIVSLKLHHCMQIALKLSSARKTQHIDKYFLHKLNSNSRPNHALP